MDFETLTYALDNHVATITITRPKAFNALDEKLSKDLYDVASHCGYDKDVRAVIITGEGDKAFCAGGDVASFAAMGEDASRRMANMTTHLHTAISRFSWMAAPTIAAVNGVAAGAGLSLMACCDLAIAADHASFTSAYTKIGMTPDGSSTYFLPRLIGHRRTMELYLTNRVLNAAEAREWGLVNSVVKASDLMAAAQEMAANIAAGAPLANAGVKRLMMLTANESLETQMERETRSIAAMAASRDGQEGFASFVARRAPNFTGE
jgi:2-(1,2-epoxy-1,2-dihydrophenyl)acetyl-CoA isomerase